MDWRNWVIGVFVLVIGYLWKKDDKRNEKQETLVGELHKAVLAMQGAVEVLKESHHFHEQTVAELRQERRDCEARCPYRGM